MVMKTTRPASIFVIRSPMAVSMWDFQTIRELRLLSIAEIERTEVIHVMLCINEFEKDCQIG